MYKIVYGIPAMFFSTGHVKDLEVEDDDTTWYDFELDYFPDKDCYLFGFETMVRFVDKDGCKIWITECFNYLTEYMKEKGYDTTKELNMYDVFTKGVSVNTHFDTIEEAYAWLKMMVYGFNGKGLEEIEQNI